jgi:hypothetical protein
VCARARVRACVCVRAYVYVCVCVGGWVWVHEHMRLLARMLAYLSSMQRAGAILSASSLAQPYFWAFSHEWYNFRKKVREHKMCVLIFCTTFA